MSRLVWYVIVRFLSKLNPSSRTLSVSSMTVLSKESFSMLGVLVNRDMNNITSVFSHPFTIFRDYAKGFSYLKEDNLVCS